MCRFAELQKQDETKNNQNESILLFTLFYELGARGVAQLCTIIA